MTIGMDCNGIVKWNIEEIVTKDYLETSNQDRINQAKLQKLKNELEVFTNRPSEIPVIDNFVNTRKTKKPYFENRSMNMCMAEPAIDARELSGSSKQIYDESEMYTKRKGISKEKNSMYAGKLPTIFLTNRKYMSIY